MVMLMMMMMVVMMMVVVVVVVIVTDDDLGRGHNHLVFVTKRLFAVVNVTAATVDEPTIFGHDYGDSSAAAVTVITPPRAYHFTDSTTRYHELGSFSPSSITANDDWVGASGWRPTAGAAPPPPRRAECKRTSKRTNERAR